MKRFKSLLTAVVATVIAAAPAATAQATAHVVGVGSSAQFLGAVLGMDQLAVNTVTAGNCVYHWTFKNGLNAHDNRDTLGRILDETGSVGIVWLATQDAGTNCPASLTPPFSSGNANITDVWLDGQYDSTLGVRLFSAQQRGCSSPPPNSSCAATVYVNQAAGTAGGGLVSPNTLWPDNAADVALPANLLSYIGSASPGNIHVNMGLTDIRPEDALFATTRSKANLNTSTYAGLGYVGPTAQIGAPILSSFDTASFTPIGFALSGGNDPINTGVPVPAYTTVPIGAAPVVFAYNNGGSYSASVSNLVTGINGYGSAGANYYLANLFDGTTVCDTTSKAFGGSGAGGGTAITLLLREPISGTMNTTEFSLFRTTGNTTDSQEKGVINPTRAPYNPLNLPCTAGGGSRRRGIGTGEITGNINTIANSLGYFFFSFANSAKVVGSAAAVGNYNYLLLDGVDPIGLPATTNQELPYCSGTSCPASQWTNSVTYPNLRNGTYKAWSLYRWTVYDTNTDSVGPNALAASIQDLIDASTSVADFVPFHNTGGDGLSVYHSHFTQSGHSCSYTASGGAQECNGSQTATETRTTPSGDTLGGGAEKGGDEGGVIIGWDHSTVTTAKQTTGACAGDTKIQKTAGRVLGFSAIDNAHTAGNPAALETADTFIDGNAVTVSSCIAPTSSIAYVTGYTGTYSTGHAFSAYITPTACGSDGCDNGVLTKHQ
jgi:hypothetical protein